MSEQPSSGEHGKSPTTDLVRKIGSLVTKGVAGIVDILFPSAKG
jgi:hypothetical protein